MTESIVSDRFVVVLSGKRKSGKDYFADLLQKRLGDQACIVRLSGPLKQAFAEERNLDYRRLLDASEYKERYREDMIAWGEARRRSDPGFFCRETVRAADAGCRVWIVSDARRKTDLAWFTAKRAELGFQTLLVRVKASVEVRRQRGWVFTANVDDAESECDLDDYRDFDLIVENGGRGGGGDDDDNVDDMLSEVFRRTADKDARRL